MRQSKHFESVLTQADLETYYESEVFSFFKRNPHVAKPNLAAMLEDYLLNIFSYRTQVGTTLAWSLPKHKKPLNSFGLPIQFSKVAHFDFEELSVYKKFREIVNAAINKDDEANKLPVSLDQVKQTYGKLPQLSLKARLMIERVLPVFKVDDFMALRITSTSQRILISKVKQLGGLFTVVTVTLHEVMECWIWTIYFPSTQRTFIATFYASDLLNID
jgi:hypothetical protein